MYAWHCPRWRLHSQGQCSCAGPVHTGGPGKTPCLLVQAHEHLDLAQLEQHMPMPGLPLHAQAVSGLHLPICSAIRQRARAAAQPRQQPAEGADGCVGPAADVPAIQRSARRPGCKRADRRLQHGRVQRRRALLCGGARRLHALCGRGQPARVHLRPRRCLRFLCSSSEPSPEQLEKHRTLTPLQA